MLLSTIANVFLRRRFSNGRCVRKLSDVSYEDLYPSLSYSSINLNIRASFESEIKSARIGFDNPRRNFCERVAPFAVFGDTKGSYKDVAIPLGQHTVTGSKLYGYCWNNNETNIQCDRMSCVLRIELWPYFSNHKGNSCTAQNIVTMPDEYCFNLRLWVSCRRLSC